MTDAPHDLEAEAAVLGTLLLAPGTIGAMLGPAHGLRPEHFYRYGRLFGAAVGLSERGDPIDAITLKAECKRLGIDTVQVEAVDGSVPSLGNWPAYVKAVKGTARRRELVRAAHLLTSAATDDNPSLVAEAERILSQHEANATVYTPERQAEDFLGGNLAPVLAPWPLAALNDLTGGGYRAGQTTLYGAWTNHGKSPLIDDTILLGYRAKGLRSALYINEMSEAERAQRFAAQLTTVGYDRISNEDLPDDVKQRVAAALTKHSIPIMNVAGWTVEDVCRDIVRSGWQNVGVDGLHMFEHENEADLSRMAIALAQCAKRTGCHIHIAGHLNEKRAEEAILPPPVLRDIRGSGHIKNAMDYVIFLWREQTEDGFPLVDGRAWFAKARKGRLGGCAVTYNGDRMRFEAR